MAPSLFFSLLLLMIIVPCYCIVNPNSTTLAIIQATGTVCGLTAYTQNRSIVCTKFSQLEESMASFPIGGTRSFDSISGGPNFLCSLRSGDTSFFCWDGIRERMKRVYRGPTALSQISVGSWHIAAIDGGRRNITWWSYGCIRHALSCNRFPKSVSGEYRSLTSGDNFTCAINGTHNVHCWGPHGKLIQRRFSGIYMDSLTAGGDRMCGLDQTGHIICTENQPNVPSDMDGFISLAIGSNHTCAIMRNNGAVICWSQLGTYFPTDRTRLEFLVSGGNLTCGLTSDAFNVSCWGLNNWAVIQSLPKILPGVCVPDEAASCSFGVYPDSRDLCGGSGVICKKLDINTSQTIWEKLLPTIVKVCVIIVCLFVLGLVIWASWYCISRCPRYEIGMILPDLPEVEFGADLSSLVLC